MSPQKVCSCDYDAGFARAIDTDNMTDASREAVAAGPRRQLRQARFARSGVRSTCAWGLASIFVLAVACGETADQPSGSADAGPGRSSTTVGSGGGAAGSSTGDAAGSAGMPGSGGGSASTGTGGGAGGATGGGGGATGGGGNDAGSTADQEWTDITRLLSAIDDAYTVPPALANVVTNGYTAGLLLGNGDVAVTCDARDGAQTYYVAKSDFWDATAGQLLFATIRISGPPNAANTGYRQQQDILNAEVRGTQTMGGQLVHSRSWTADGENLLVTELWTDANAQPVPIQVELTATAGSSGMAGTNQVWIARATGTDADTGWVAKAAASTKVVGSPTAVAASAPAANTARLSLTLPANTPVQVVTSIHGKGTYDNSAPLAAFTMQATNRIGQIGAANVDAARAAHRDWWKQFWLKSYLDTGDATLNKFYYGALYAVAAANRAGFLPGGTYSPWRTGDSANLANRYFLNYNTESQYYGVYSANRPEVAEPYYRVIQAAIPYARNRTHAAGYKGVTFPRTVSPYDTTRSAPATTPVAATKNSGKLPSDQQTNGTAAAIPFFWAYEYTGDMAFFRDVTYPFLKELGDFWVDFVERDAATGQYVVRHSAVNEGGDDLNSVYDLGFIRRVLTFLIDGSKTLGVDAALRPGWQDVLDHLTPYPTGTMNGLEVILLASQINNSTKGNALLNKNDQPINLEGVVHPSDNLAIGGDARLLQLVHNTLEWVDPFLPGSRGSSLNGFPKTFTIAARAGWDPEDLIGKFRRVIKNLWRPNLTVRQSGGGQETSGALETIDSMMLQTYQGVTRVFPAWPKARDAKFVRLRAKGAFTVSSQLRGGTVEYVAVGSDKGNPFTLVNPWGNEDRRGRRRRRQRRCAYDRGRPHLVRDDRRTDLPHHRPIVEAPHRAREAIGNSSCSKQPAVR